MDDEQIEKDMRQRHVLPPRDWWTKKRLIRLCLVVMILAGLGVGAWWLLAKTNLIIKHNVVTEISIEDRANTLLESAATYRNAGQLDEALGLAIQSDNIDPTSTVESFIAQIYMEKEDKANAISYFQKAISNIDPEDQYAAALQEDYEKTIQYINENM
jgi:tetratricopeptide (TPR) repeat protein